MKNVFLFVMISIVSVVLISNLGLGSITAYAERDILQEWKDYVESYKNWADSKFIEYEKKIEVLTNKNIELRQEIKSDNNQQDAVIEPAMNSGTAVEIRTLKALVASYKEKQSDSDSKIKQLENEIIELNQKIESDGTQSDAVIEPTQLDQTSQQGYHVSPHITTDKLEYSLGDTVYVTGKLMSAQTKQLLNGTVVYPSSENINVSIIAPDHEYRGVDGLKGCSSSYPYDETQFTLHLDSQRIFEDRYDIVREFGKYYYHHDYSVRTECNIHNGKMIGSFEITDDFTAGIHKIKYVHQTSPMNVNTDRYVYSQSFTIK